MNSATTQAKRLQTAIVGLTVATAAIHLGRALANPHIVVLFTLNALGYLALLALLYLPPARRRVGLVRRVFIGYAGLTFVLFFAWGFMKGEWPIIGFVDKAIEILLIVLLLREARGQVESNISDASAPRRASASAAPRP
jgi:hypothetical protein